MNVPRIVVPVLVVLLAAAGLGAARLIAIPSVELEFSSATTDAPSREVAMLVDGVKCVDTARTAASTLEGTPGVLRFVAYASRNRVDVTYDPSIVDVERLRELLEGPVFDEESGEFFFGLFRIVEIDGRPVSE